LQSDCQVQKKKKACFKAKVGAGKKLLAFLFEEINALKRQLMPGKTSSSKKRKAEFILSTEINLTNISDKGENKDSFLTSSKRFSSIKTKLTKSSRPITELVLRRKPHCQS
jgi:hypothetical protein